MEARKVLVKEDDLATISCPGCGKTKKLSMVPYKQNSKRDLRLSCSCENGFCLCLEYRRDRRKSVRLLGKSINLSNHRESQDIIIKNISMGKLAFIRLKSTKTSRKIGCSYSLNLMIVIYTFKSGCKFTDSM